MGGKRGSLHLPEDVRVGASKEWGGAAFDILADPTLQVEIIARAVPLGFTGIGQAATFVHLDDGHPDLTVWRY
jgi:hypothetical protein